MAATHLLVAALVVPFSVPFEDASAQTRHRKAASGQKKRVSGQASRGRGQSLDMRRERLALPKSQKMSVQQPKRSMKAVKPPSSSSFYEGDSKEAEYEKLVDQEIKALYALSQQNRRSRNRGEFWLRLGERYAEKARLIEFRMHAEYEKKLKDYLDKKTRIKPKLDTTKSREYNRKAVQLYEWFIKDFPKDPKVDQALFFLGYNHFELGNTKKGEHYYNQLVKSFPRSLYVTESHFALGEYYFENDQWQKALDNYVKVIRVKKARLNTFALYKAAWCLYRLNRTQAALKFLERVVRLSRAPDTSANVAGRKAVNKVRLASEAMRDYVPFYSEIGDAKRAASEFKRVAGNDEQEVFKMLERLAFIYADGGNRSSANYLFKQLISFNPSGEKAAEYQYQVVLAYATSDQKEFRKELDIWLESFGPTSYWARQNAGNKKLVTDVAKLQETTLRNHVLQLHQTAQNSRAPYSQRIAASGYIQYLKHFPDTPQTVEMQFFYAELLFDMQRYEEAARVYTMVADRDPKGPYREKAIVNSLLALEKDLPSAESIEKKRGDSLEKIPLDPSVQRFEKAALRYMESFPKGDKVSDIQRRLGVLYYSYNHFDEAVAMFEKIVRDDPKSANAEIAGNLILDIYKLKNDMVGFTDKGQQLLAIPAISNSKFGNKVRDMMETASYMKAEKMADSGDSLKAAKEFDAFAATYKKSDLAPAARYKAAVNYEKGGDITSSIKMHSLVIMTPSSDPKIKSVQNDSRNSLARMYQQTGQLELAAKQYQTYADVNKKDQKAIDAYYNAGVLWESLGETDQAMQSYQAYFALSKRADRVEVLFSQAEILNSRGQTSRANAMYEQYLNSGPRSEAHAIKAAFMIAQNANKLGQASKARQWYQRTIEIYRKSGKAGKEGGVAYAAESRFALAQETLKKLMGIRFTANDKQQAQAAAQVQSLREKYIGEMKEVILFDNGGFIVAALASSGQMFDGLAAMFTRIPVPAGFADEDAKKYKELIQVQIDGFRKEAKNSYKAAVDKSQELESYNDWSRLAHRGLAAYDPALVNDAGEIAADTSAADWMGL